MKTTKKLAAGLIGIVALAGAGTGIAVAAGDGGSGDGDAPITGTALDRATAAALAETGGGAVTETEQGDEESAYQVEVTLDNGHVVDVNLDGDFHVVKTKDEGPEDAGDDGPGDENGEIGGD